MPLSERLPAITGTHRTSTAILGAALEDVDLAICVLDGGFNSLSQIQRELYLRWRETTLQFARDLLLVDGNQEELRRRVGLT